MNKNKLYLKETYYELVKELSELIEHEGAESTCLNFMEQLPEEIQVNLIRHLAKTNNPKLIPFLQLVKKELAGEVKKEAQKTLVKLCSLGYNIEPMEYTDIPFDKVKCFVSPTRLRGNCILVFLVKTSQEYQAHYFVLLFNHLGVKEYFHHRSFRENELLANIKRMHLVPVDIVEGVHLLKEAYLHNQRHGTKAARSFFQYKNFLGKISGLSAINHQRLVYKLHEGEIKPFNIINAYLLALKNMDAALIYDLASADLQKKLGDRTQFLQNWCHPLEKYLFIKSVFEQSTIKDNRISQQIGLIACTENEELRKITFQFELVKINQEYYIDNVEIKGIRSLSMDDPLNPLNTLVYVAVFNFTCPETIEKFLREEEDIHVTGEFAGGVCYKWFRTEDPIEKGIDVSKDVYGEFILTGKELIVFGESLTNVTEICYLLADKLKQTKELVSLQLRGKGLFPVKEIYQIINNPENLLTDVIVNQNYSYFIPSIGYAEWYKYCQNYANKTSTVMLDGEVKVFHLHDRQNTIEVIFHEGYGVINLLGNSLDQSRETFNFPEVKIFSVQDLLNNQDDKESWLRVRLISILNKDPLAKIYTPVYSPGRMARKLNLVISN